MLNGDYKFDYTPVKNSFHFKKITLDGYYAVDFANQPGVKQLRPKL